MEKYSKLIAMDSFFETRNQVLGQWVTGAQADFEKSVAYHHKIPDNRNFSKVLMQADKTNNTLTQPRAGVALLDEHIELLKYLESKGEADLLPTTIDSYTRHNRYDEAQIGIMWSHGGRAKHGRYGINLSDGIVVINEDGTLSLVDEKGKTLRTIVPSDAVQKKLRLLVIACKQKKSEWGKVVKNTNLTTSDDEKTNGHIVS